MSKIKRVKLDRYEYSEYGTENWCRVYIKYRGQFYKIYQLVLADFEMSEQLLAIEMLRREKELMKHIKGIAKEDHLFKFLPIL